ncbi:[weak similarity to] O-methyltransferase, family 3 [methanotrophic bacterial endosymbiont of Bathymodiolus sp.]|nr:[weak similarity to] O-methyltransferase, family 3 [methanotrophic bacterial endosymbiont of Bathymodiolus sp.]
MLDSGNVYRSEVIKEVSRLPCSHPASVNIDVANLYYSLTKMVRPLLVVEIGCFIGFSTLHFAQALREQGFGKIISIDAFDWDVDAGNGEQNRQEVAEHYRKKSQLEDIITYVKGYSGQVYADLTKDIEQQIDLLYIDGDHSVKGAFEDFNTYYDDVRVGGYLILHDIFPSMCGVNGPRVLIDALKKSGNVPKNLDLIEMQTRDGFGISILRKLNSHSVRVTPSVDDVSQLLVKKIWRKLTGNSTPSLMTSNEQIKILIKIVDSETSQPVAGAEFVCPQRWNEQRVAGADGLVVLDHYLPNRYQVTLSAAGYNTKAAILLDVKAEISEQEFIIKLDKS